MGAVHQSSLDDLRKQESLLAWAELPIVQPPQIRIEYVEPITETVSRRPICYPLRDIRVLLLMRHKDAWPK